MPPGRVKCGYCWAEWPVTWYSVKAKKHRSGWVALARHLDDRAGEGGHPDLTPEQLAYIQRGFEPAWMRQEARDAY